MKITRKNKNLFRVEVPDYEDKRLDTIGMAKWCQTLYGEESKKGSPRFRWRYGWLRPDSNVNGLITTYFFYFKEEKDAVYFVLNWA